MKQANAFLPIYTADNSGMCAALYELGGLVVMHDASGCNSTYTTHDEPRWWDFPSGVYISGLTEVDAVLGNEQRLIDDIVTASEQTRPNFIALGGTPIPMMMGCDYAGIMRVVEQRTGIISFGVETNGTLDYVSGQNKAFLALCKRVCRRIERTHDSDIKVNILGVSPLDFSINGSDIELRNLISNSGFKVNAVLAMHSSFDEICNLGQADVNLVVTGSGLATAEYLYASFGIPFVIGCPIGNFMTKAVINALEQAARLRQNINLAVGCRGNSDQGKATYIIGESVMGAAMRASLIRDEGLDNVRVLTSLWADENLLSTGDHKEMREDDYLKLLAKSAMVIADPLFKILPVLQRCETVEFVDLPHEAFSGRMWRSSMVNLFGQAFNTWYSTRHERPSLT